MCHFIQYFKSWTCMKCLKNQIMQPKANTPPPDDTLQKKKKIEQKWQI